MKRKWLEFPLEVYSIPRICSGEAGNRAWERKVSSSQCDDPARERHIDKVWKNLTARDHCATARS